MNHSNSEERLTSRERARMISKIRSPLFWVGRLIPETETIDGERVNLREVVLRYIAKEQPSKEDMEGAIALADKLKHMVGQMEGRIKHEDITQAEAKEVLDHILSLMRAIDELRRGSSVPSDIRLKAIMRKVDDQRRWLDFVRSVT